jgi:two-component system response regulator AtoC
MARFHEYDWPGNVRELENLVRRLVVLKDPSMVLGELANGRAAPQLGAPHAGAALAPPGVNVAQNVVVPPPRAAEPAPGSQHAPLPEDAPLKEVGKRAARIAEREAILRALGRTGWNKRKAAKRLQISYKALLYKIKECEIVDPRNAAMLE